MKYRVKKCRNLRGIICLPGDKSISHRALLMSSIAEGETIISNLSSCRDVQATLRCLLKLGINFTYDQHSIKINGQGLYSLSPCSAPLNAGNSGTTVRLLSGILAAQPFHSSITGDKYLSRRPMDRIIVPLRKMGADIKAKDDRYLPLEITGKTLFPIHYHSPIASAQVKSCTLLAGLYTDGDVSVTEPLASRDHTEKMLSSFGVDIIKENTTTIVQGNKKLQGIEVTIPGDISSAAFFITAALLIKDSSVTLKNTGINPTRTGILTALKDMGAKIVYDNVQHLNLEPVTDLTVTSQKLTGTVIGNPLIPQIIDEIPVLTIAATQAHGETKIVNAQELRVKETDRIHALYINLKAMGAEVTELDDGLIIRGPTKLHGTEIETFGDHRIAMAFSIAGLLADGTTIINNCECTEISFPGFYSTLEDIYA